MAFDPVPYFVEEGAEHSADTMRLLAYVVFGGQEGIVDRLNWRVNELSVPGTSIRVMPGAGAIINRAAGKDYQMYVGRMPTETQVAITPTDASGDRSDLIVARVENPHIPGEGWPLPATNAGGPYIFARVIEDVPPTTTTVESLHATIGVQSAIPLARLDIPASTGTITQDMITDLRIVANPMTGIGGGAEKEISFITDTPSGSRLAPGVGWVSWPAEATWQVPVPAWATHVEWVSWFTPNMTGHSWGSMRMSLDGVTSGSTFFDDNFNSGNGGGGQRTLIRSVNKMTVPASMRGRTVEAHLEGTQNATTGSGLTVDDLVAGSGTQITTEFTFKQKAVYA